MPAHVWKTACGLWCALSLAAIISYGLAKAADDFQSVRDFLTPPAGCPSPCWMGIRPGVTDSLEAVETLKALPWVTNLYAIQGIVINDSYIRWEWNGTQPPVVDGKRQGRMWFHNGLVYSIELPLTLTYSAVWGAFGAPEIEVTRRSPASPPQVFYSAAYFDGTMSFTGSVLCPPRGYNWLAAPVNIVIAVPKPADDLRPMANRAACENARRGSAR